MIAFLDLLDNEEDKEKFKELYNKYSQLLYCIAKKKLNNNEDAEECVQDTFFYIAKNFDKVRDIDSVSTQCYLSTIVSGYVINKYKRLKKIEFISIEEIKNEKNLEDFTFLEKYDAIEIALLIDKLKDDTKNFLYLTYIFGYTSKEIAHMYHLSEFAVRKRLSRAKVQLRKMLEVCE